MYNVAKIAYVTDLHLGSAPTAASRLASFSSKLVHLRDIGVGCVINGGDLADLRPDMWKPQGLVDSGAALKRLEYTEYSEQIALNIMPPIVANIRGYGGLLSIFGNADYLSLSGMISFRSSLPDPERFKHLFPTIIHYSGEMHEVISDGRHIPLVISGISGIPALPHDPGSVSVNENNPWYKGVLSERSYKDVLDNMMFPDNTTIFLSHMPALGTLDSFFHRGKQALVDSQGSADIRDMIARRAPILHLTGHVHDAPMATGRYRPFSVGLNGTVTINPGGGDLHDKEVDGINGVKIAVIDPYRIFDLRRAGKLTEDAVVTENLIEVI